MPFCFCSNVQLQYCLLYLDYPFVQHSYPTTTGAARMIKGLLCCSAVLVILWHFFFTIKTETGLSTFVALSGFCLAGEAKIGNTANMLVSNLFLTVITKVCDVTDMAGTNLFFALWTEGCHATDVAIPNLFLTIQAEKRQVANMPRTNFF